MGLKVWSKNRNKPHAASLVPKHVVTKLLKSGMYPARSGRGWRCAHSHGHGLGLLVKFIIT